jgi:uncharacterized protein
MLDSSNLQQVYLEIQSGIDCCAKSCGYFDYCGGGAPVNKLSENGRLDSTETLFCRLTKQAWINVCLRLSMSPQAQFHSLLPG